MLKSILILVFAFSTSAFAAECIDKDGKDITSQPEIFQDLIAKASSCYEAKSLAEACAWGSSLDVSTAGTAYEVCQKELTANKPSKQLTKMLSTMTSMCNRKYANEQGTMYRSMNAYCNLTSIEWVLGLATPN